MHPADAGILPHGRQQAEHTLADEENVGAGAVIHPARLAVSGRSYGPGVFGLMAAVGKEACIRRMHRAAETLG